VRVSVSDTGGAAFDALLEGFDIEISVGIHEDKGAEAHGKGATTTALVGAAHEFGLGPPQRSFIRGYYDENAALIVEQQDAALARILDGADPLIEAQRMGLFIESGIKERILARINPPLSEATRKRRGESAVPLVDTSQLIRAITSQVTVKK
jgi:hypothetical protein